MTKEQFKEIAKIMMKAKAEIDNILECDSKFNVSYHDDRLFFDNDEGFYSTPICDIDNANIIEYHGFFVKKEEF